jgi:GntR family transcriptional regulator/MocR family aminotransferase
MKPANIPLIMLDETGLAPPFHKQIYNAIRGSILDGSLVPGMRLPSTRQLSNQLGVARMTVVNAYEQLLAEGYLDGLPGAGTFVAATLPEELLRVRPDQSPNRKQRSAMNPILSRCGKWLASTNIKTLRVQADSDCRAFQNGLPALDEFPFKLWSQLASRRLRYPTRDLLGYGDPAGYRPLREAIATHLRSARGVHCDPSQVLVVSGAQQAVDIAARVLLDPDDVAWVEEPGYPGVRAVLQSTGARVVPVAVDFEGFDLRKALQTDKRARLAYVTPSHQFPLGVTMSLSRRLSLLDWARRFGTFVIEDDYNSEFRYSGRPLPSLQGLDRYGRVIYVGTFSKTVFPSLRLGCMVVPEGLTEIFVAARALVDRHSPSLDQAVLADFINEGHFSRHIRRMRSLYAERQQIMVEAIERELKGVLNVSPANAGMHLVGWLPKRVSDKTASEKAARHGVEANPLSAYSIAPLSRGGLVLGYTTVNARQIKNGVQLLAKALS